MGIFPLFFAVTNLDLLETHDQVKAHLRPGPKRFGNARLERSMFTTARLAFAVSARPRLTTACSHKAGCRVFGATAVGQRARTFGHGGYNRARESQHVPRAWQIS